jgi:hypothetical protein
MRYADKIAVGGYLAFCFVGIYWGLDRQLLYGSDAAGLVAIVVVAVVHVGVGFAVGRNWAVLLPLIAVAIAVPLGYPSANRGEPLPIWLALLYFLPFAIALVAIGIGARRLYERGRAS